MRFVIKREGGGYFTEMAVIETKDVTINGVLVGRENQYMPLFEAFKPTQAVHFDKTADADNQMTNNPAWHGGPEAFANCVVEETNS